MKYFVIIIFLVITGCSFDNKSGIWNSGRVKDVKKIERFKDFETLYSEEKSFNQIIFPKSDFIINLGSVISTSKWSDNYYNNSNNLGNFNFKDTGNVAHKSKKLTKYQVNSIHYIDNLFVITDTKGNLIMYSLQNQKIILNFNFYKKKYKKTKKFLNALVEKDIVYISDNFGYAYAINFKNGKLIWAKKFDLPFRSNIKISDKSIFLSDLNNSLLILNKFTGDKLKSVPTEEALLKNDFINSLAIKNENLFYLNTYGSLYSLDKNNLTINWFKNLNKSLDLNFSNLFFSNSVILHNQRIIISTDPYLYILRESNGSTLIKKPITSIFNPIISGDYIFLITKDNLLACINLKSGQIIYSLNIDQQIADFLNTKKRSVNIKSFSIVNNSLYIFLTNSYLLKFSKEGKIKVINKLNNKINSIPIFVDDSILYLNNKNQLIVLN